MTDKDIEKVKGFIKNDVHRFYTWKKWRKIRAEVLKLDHNECVVCKAKHKRYPQRAYVVHHVHHLKDRPDLALEIWDEEGKRNLISVCSSCHEELHPEKLKEAHKFVKRESKAYHNEEKW